MKLGLLFDGGVPAGAEGVEIAGATADSRRVRPGYLFAALKGVEAHGRDFVDKARAAGAVAVLSAGDLLAEPGVAHVVAPDPRLALALAAARLHPRQPAHMAAVTGTNGKSSTVDFLRQIWAADSRAAASLGTLGSIWSGGRIDLGHTTADPVQIHATLDHLAAEGVTHAAMEASSHGLDQRRLDGVRLSVGAFTNLTQDHLDYHGDMAHYRAAKLRLWSLLPKGAPAIVNADAEEGPAFEAAARAAGLTVVLAGWRADGEGLKIREIQPRPAGQTVDLLWRGVEARVALPLIGEFQALNAVTAAAMALAGGADASAVFAGLERLAPVNGRMEHIGETAAGAQVFVDYAHTPHGLEVLLRAARPHAPGRLIVVFGCGGDRDRGKRPLMGAIAHKLSDVVIVTDDNPRTEDAAAIRAAVLAAAPGAHEIPDRAAAIAAALRLAGAGDAVLIAGKGHETGQIIGRETLPFSDQETARAALGGQGAPA